MSAKDLFQKLGYEYNEDYKECLFRYVNEIVIGDWRIDLLRMLGEIDD